MYFENNFHCRKIYAIEADKGIFTTLKENIALLPTEMSEKCLPINYCVSEDSEWEFLNPEEKVSLINADIEGAELSLIHSLRERIIKDRPVLAICVYHLKEDLVDIPRYLLENFENYSFYLRKYACYQGAYKGTCELVLYAVPFERKVND